MDAILRRPNTIQGGRKCELRNQDEHTHEPLSAVAKYSTEATLSFRRPSAHGKGGMGAALLISSRAADSEAKTRQT